MSFGGVSFGVAQIKAIGPASNRHKTAKIVVLRSNQIEMIPSRISVRDVIATIAQSKIP